MTTVERQAQQEGAALRQIGGRSQVARGDGCRALLIEAGRDPGSFGLDARIRATGGPADWVAAAQRWRALGATHLCLGAGRGIPAAQQLETAIAMKQALTGVL